MRVRIEGEAPSTPNLREHHMARARRVKKQRVKARIAMLMTYAQFETVLVVRLTRVGKRFLDGDNLQGALKAYRDGVADYFAVDDRTPLIRWEYAQEKGEPAVLVEVSRAE